MDPLTREGLLVSSETLFMPFAFMIIGEAIQMRILYGKKA